MSGRAVPRGGGGDQGAIGAERVRTKKLTVAFHFQHANQASWKCDMCRKQGLEEARRCGWIAGVAEMPPRMVWGRRNFAADRCPKSIVDGKSISYLEMYHAWRMAGRGELSGYPAKAVEAFATLERLYREDQDDAGNRH